MYSLRRGERDSVAPPCERTQRVYIVPDGLWDVSYTSFDFRRDDSCTGRGRMTTYKRTCVCGTAIPSSVSLVQRGLNGENTELMSWITVLLQSVNCSQFCCCLFFSNLSTYESNRPTCRYIRDSSARRPHPSAQLDHRRQIHRENNHTACEYGSWNSWN